MEGILLDTMFDLPSLEGVEEVVKARAKRTASAAAAGAPGDLFSPCHCGSGPPRHVSDTGKPVACYVSCPKKRRRTEVSLHIHWQH
jgi:hypothetical protein